MVPTPTATRARLGLAAVTIGLLTLWLHWPATRGEFLHWDDTGYLKVIAQWQRISWASVRWAFTSTGTDYYSPLTWLSYFYDHQVAGVSAHRFHATNVVIHALNAGVVCLLTWVFAGHTKLGTTARLGLATGVGLVFGIHPLQVESVAWVAERKNVLSAHFVFWTLLVYLHAARASRPARWRALAVGLFVLALLAKPQAVTVPVVMLALDLYPLRRWPTTGWARLIREKAVWWLLSLMVAVTTVGAVFPEEGVEPVSTAGVLSRWLVAARGAIFYLWKLLWPAWLSPYYPLEGEISLRIPEFAVTSVVCVALCASAVWSARRWPVWTSLWTAYLALLLPVIGLIRVGNQAAADRYMYLALVPLVLGLAGGGIALGQRLGRIGKLMLIGLAGCYLAFLGMSTHAQIPVWRTDVSMWHTAWKFFPKSGLVNTALSKALARQGNLAEAAVLARHAVALNPETEETRLQLGVVLLLQGDHHAAIPEIETAIRLAASQHQPWPNQQFAQYNLARAYCRAGQLARAAELLAQALPVAPEFLSLARTDRYFENLRADPEFGPRFKALVNPE